MKRYFSMALPLLQLKLIVWTAGLLAGAVYMMHVMTGFEKTGMNTNSEMDTSLAYRTNPNSPPYDTWSLLPDSVIIGSPKCGTTALLFFMALHPDIYKIPAKANIFSNFVQELPDYLPTVIPWNVSNLFKVEKTPSYWRRSVTYSDLDIRNMKDIYTKRSKTVKLVLVVCDPFTRILSAWGSYDCRSHKVPRFPTFKSLVINKTTGELRAPERPFDVGLYDLILPLWLKYFNRDQIHVVDGEALKKNPYNEVKKLEKFFDLKDYIKRDMIKYDHAKGFYCPVQRGIVQCLPENKGREHIEVSPKIAQRIKNYFLPHNKNFSKMVHQSFSWTTYS